MNLSFSLIEKNRPYRYDYLLALLSNNGLSPNIVSQAARIGTVLLLVETGVGITVLPKHIITFATPLSVLSKLKAEMKISRLISWRHGKKRIEIRRFLCFEFNTLDFEQIIP